MYGTQVLGNCVPAKSRWVSPTLATMDADYKECHDVGYDEYGSMESQRAIDDGAIRGQGLVHVVELASSIATYAARVASAATPPWLPSERCCGKARHEQNICMIVHG